MVTAGARISGREILLTLRHSESRRTMALRDGGFAAGVRGCDGGFAAGVRSRVCPSPTRQATEGSVWSGTDHDGVRTGTDAATHGDGGFAAGVWSRAVGEATSTRRRLCRRSPEPSRRRGDGYPLRRRLCRRSSEPSLRGDGCDCWGHWCQRVGSAGPCTMVSGLP